ncbi:MAG TPA: protein phosphatase 2C domain-containing protein [Mycobacteriales bacterium]|nr:protein phosphatase 2C domain-containing protein [Mycobacteriales bacterium]
MSLTLHYAARSDRGLIREANEDSLYAGPRLLAVADGMGGMAAGEVASNIVIASLEPLDTDASSLDLISEFRAAVNQANQQLRDAVKANSALEGMGTTLTAMLFSGTRIAVGHVGDSRAYVWRDNELSQITRDDTYVQMLVDEGRITADEATTHPQRSLLTRALDGRDVEPEFSIREAQAGDRYLLCSDGLSGVVSPQTIADALGVGTPQEAADRLISLALRGGGPDNITCVVADIVTEPLGSNEPIVAGAAAHDRGRTNSATPDSAAGRAALAQSAAAASMVDDQATDSVDADTERPEGSDGTVGKGDQPDPPQTERDRQRRLTRIAVFTGIIVLILLGAGYAGWHYTQQQYYVGPVGPDSQGESRHVAIHRGVPGSILGIDFSSVVERSDIRLSDLPQLQRRDVENIVTADSKAEAKDILARLDDRLLPPCDGLRNANKQNGSPSPAPTDGNATAASTEPSPVPDAKPSVNCRETDNDSQVAK